MLRIRRAETLDRHRTRSRRLIAAPRAAALGVAAGLALIAAAPAGVPIRALRWTDPASTIEAVTSQPAECLRLPPDPAERASVEIGRAAFRTPMLLGGQAARLGLSCESCHRNGRGNPAFLFPSLSGAPGTADVTNALMSTHRDNALFDPKPIPDLAATGKIDRSAARSDLRDFIHGLIVQEFDGAEPPPAVLSGLTAYVRGISAESCTGRAGEALTAAWGNAAIRGAAAARERLATEDSPSALLMLAAARSALGHLDEAYADLPAEHARLLRADAALLALRKAIERRDPRAPAQISRWEKAAPGWRAQLARAEGKSLFNPAVLKDRLQRNQPALPGANPAD